jgi:hypothetical protein
VFGVEEGQQLKRAREGLAAAAANMLNEAAQLFPARLRTVHWVGSELDHERLHRLLANWTGDG